MRNIRPLFLLMLLLIPLWIALSPFLNGSGLENPEPIDAYLNGVFPTVAPSEDAQTVVAFPNLTFNSPLTWAMHPNDETVFVGQRDGIIYRFDNDDNVADKALFLDISSQVGVVWDGGFLGMVPHPNFGVSGATGRNYFYVFYSTRDSNGGHEPTSPLAQLCPEDVIWNGNHLILSRFEVEEGTLNVVENSELTMIKVRMYNSTHRGGGMVFGQDGFLYLTTGDQAAHLTAQDIANNLDGGVMRLDVDMDASRSHAPIRTMPQDVGFAEEISGVGYYIPNDNPFPSSNGATFEEYYSLGHRNPHRMTMDTETGTMYIGEIGSNRHEEINVLEAGGNYGWPLFEGHLQGVITVCNSNTISLDDGTYVPPLVAFERSEANAIIGGYVYRGSDLPSLWGKYICADYGGGEEIFCVNTTDGTYEELVVSGSPDIISFGQDHEGEVYILSQGDNVNIHKLAPSNETADPPATLSATGAFSDLASLTPASGLIPYELIESFWSDGAVKKRWMALPNDGTHDTPEEQISYSTNGEWEFPNGTVFVKHFDYPIDETNPSVTRRLETRFTVIDENGNAYGVTYKWREDGSDADLLEVGLDETFTVTTAFGTREQSWHYPSRSECTTCHNSAVGGTLGPRSRYLNSDYTYASTGITANQLVTLSSIGALDRILTDDDLEQCITYSSRDDQTATLEQRARSYLDLNCGYCHRPGTGNRAVFDARLTTPLYLSNLFSDQLNESLGIDGEKLIEPGDTSRSVIYKRIHSIDQSIMMPPLAKGMIDVEGAQLIADWIMGIEADDVPSADINGLKGEYYDNMDLTSLNLTRTDDEINFDWGTGSPDDGIDANTFSIRWTGYIIPEYSENYTFYTRSDDGIKLWVNNQLLIDKWINQAPTEWSGTIDLEASTFYEVTIEYYENGGGAVAELSWESASQTKEIISNRNLFTEIPANRAVALNLALNRPATQSSTFDGSYSFAAANAVDGNQNGDDAGNSITHTNNELEAWWEVDLEEVQVLDYVRIWNRDDCCSDRLSNFYVLVSDEPFASTDLTSTLNQEGVSSYYYDGAADRETVIDFNRSGRYLRIQLSGTNFLQLAEVEVMGCSVDNRDLAIGESGFVNASDAWTTVELGNTYDDPVVIAGAPGYNGGNRSTVRVRNVTENSFDIHIDEWDCLDGAHATEEIPYMVLETGVHTLANGRKIMAGKDSDVDASWKAIAFQESFDEDPLVFAQIVSENSTEAMVTRINHLTTDVAGTEIRIQNADQTASGVETVAWIAVEPGEFTGLDAIIAGSIEEGVDEAWHQLDFSFDMGDNPIFISGIGSNYDEDAAALRHRSLTSTDVEIFVEEEECSDSETDHAAETVNYIAFAMSGPIVGQSKADTSAVPAGDLIVEAEDAEIFGDFIIEADVEASAGYYVHVPNGTGSHWNLNEDHRIDFTFNVDSSGTYKLRGYVNSNSGKDNSFYVRVNGTPAAGYLWDTAKRTGTAYEADWVIERDASGPLQVALDAGVNTVSLYQREDGTRIDKMELVPAETRLVLEAEDAELYGGFVIESDPLASGGEYIHVPNGTGSNWTLNSGDARAEFIFDVDSAGTFQVRGYINSTSYKDNSFFVTVNDSPATGYLWDTNAKTGTDYLPEFVIDRDAASPAAVTLDPGSHTVVVYLREDGTRLDKLELIRVDSENFTQPLALGNGSYADSVGFDAWRSSMVVNMGDTYTNTTDERQNIRIDDVRFIIGRLGNPITPFVVKINNVDDFTAVSIGITRTSERYQLGLNSFNYCDSSMRFIGLEPGEKIGIGFIDGNMDGSGSQTVIPYGVINARDRIWYSGDPNGVNGGSIALGEGPSHGDQVFTTLKRDYRFGIDMVLLNPDGSETPIDIVPFLPEEFALRQNYPNPFNPETTINFMLPEDSPVKMTIYNVRGQLVRRLLDTQVKAGFRNQRWDGRDDFGNTVGSGMYFLVFDTPQFHKTIKMILLK